MVDQRDHRTGGRGEHDAAHVGGVQPGREAGQGADRSLRGVATGKELDGQAAGDRGAPRLQGLRVASDQFQPLVERGDVRGGARGGQPGHGPPGRFRQDGGRARRGLVACRDRDRDGVQQMAVGQG
ncbi:hypothetical protein C1J01_13515 [Nonomuraea aridisoli]|uniref:Uncharacterized protein n=1 Tax=Nonomuraea aridisoli TaxID=2070368 RepID=A0A2W2EQA9_9ACTN|nr:hypothetical protein C1J01_13515 [Nonomuraea aridisoli]